MAENIDSNASEGFKPAFKPSGDTNGVPAPGAEMITIPPELNPNPSGYEPTDQEIEAEAAPYLDMGPGSNAEVRNDARSRLIRKANGGEEPSETPVLEAVSRVVPDMPEGPSDAMKAVMAGEEGAKLEIPSENELDTFVAKNELAPEDEASLVSYAKIVRKRTEAQVAGNWGEEAKIRAEQKEAYNTLSEKARSVADAYASRYLKDIDEKEKIAKAA